MILIVDDDPIFLTNAINALETHEPVHCAADAPGAMRLMREANGGFGVALVDLNLPGISGFDLIQAIRVCDSGLPIIAMSGVLSDAPLDTARCFGAVETLRKPISGAWKLTINRVRRYRQRDN